MGASLALCAMAAVAKDEPADQIARGKQVYDYNCIACHGSGPGFPPFPELPGTAALRARYGNTVPALLTERTNLTPEFVAVFVRNGISVMPFYRKTEINDAELAALGAYLSRNNPDLKTK
jgi:mono/diheme cytochrome c family protein